MSDALSRAEIAAYHVELLPARTVLSMLHPGGIEVGGSPGQPGAAGIAGAAGESISGQSTQSQSYPGHSNGGGLFGWIEDLNRLNGPSSGSSGQPA